jgi:histone acetyltransferase (RNA polymerase elongator complex component)
MKMNKSTNASIFIPHLGCPHKCSFCDQNQTTRVQNAVSGSNTASSSNAVGTGEVRDILENYIVSLKQRKMTAQIGYFGGTFTALNHDYREQLLTLANEYIENHGDVFTGLRCSTRPDYINEKVLSQLKNHNVNVIELGAQSMNEEVLLSNNRNHTSDDVRESSRLIKEFGFELGLQMMTGLYKDTIEKSLYTADELIKLKPDTVRIYPTVILKGTTLGDLYESGRYETFSLNDTVTLCAELYDRFIKNNIRVIRLGLNISKNSDLNINIIGGNYGLQLGELCIGRYYYNRMLDFMKLSGSKKFKIYTDRRNISKINGHKSENKIKLLQLGFTYKIKEKTNADLEIEGL